MKHDAKEYAKRCDKCQCRRDNHLAPSSKLKSLSSPWPFSWWDLELLRPFVVGTNQNKYLIVVVDYFTKWIESRALARITVKNILLFYKRNILAWFSIPQAIVTDNVMQFTDKNFQELVANLGTIQHLSSIVYP